MSGSVIVKIPRIGLSTAGRRLRALPGSLVLVLFLSLAGCAANAPDPLTEYSTISFSQPDFSLRQGDTLYWRSELVYLYGDEREAPAGVRPFLQAAIQDHLEAGGYRFVPDGTAAEYGLVAVVVLGSGLTAEDVLSRFRLTPSFKASREYQEGTIVVALYDYDSERILWRGAVQGNVDLELPPEERQRRVREAVSRLLAKLPRE